MSYVDPACRGLLAAVFLVAVVGKVRSRAAFSAFAASLADVSLLPVRLRRAAAVGVTAAEAVAAILLLTPLTEAAVAGFALAFALLAVFAAAVALALRRGEAIRCLCFGSDAGAMDRSHVVRNAVLAAVALTGLISSLTSTAAAAPAGLIGAAGAGVVLGALATRWDDLRYLLSHS